MAHVFTQDVAGCWALAPLDSDCFVLDPALRRPLKPISDDARPRSGILLQRIAPASRRAWILLSAPQARVFVNGDRVLVGMRLLRDRDEILVYPMPGGRRRAKSSPCAKGVRLFFSTEELAQVVPFPAAAHEVFCVRCQQVIDARHPAVQCPNPECGHWHHAGGELECWTYEAACAMCNQSTAADADSRWTPEDL